MRRPLQIVLAVLVVLLGAASAVLYQRYRTTQQDYQTTKAAEDAARNQYVEVLGSIGEIQDSLNAIEVGDSTAAALATRSKELPSAPDRAQALERISILRSSIQHARARIDQLESRLHRSGVRVAGLEKMVANLKRTVAEREESLAALTTQVDSLHTQVTGLTAQVQQTQDTLQVRDQTLEERRRELGTIYYVVGTKRELRDKGIIYPKGGVLGLGRTLALSGRGDETVFTPLDTDAETVVRTPAMKTQNVQVLSAQPPDSYQLVNVDGHVELHITNPLEFRKIKRLVILEKA